MSPAEKQLLKAAHKILLRDLGPTADGPVAVVVVSGHAVTVKFEQRPAPEEPQQNPDTLKAQIRQALTHKVQSLKRLASVCSHKPDSYFRRLLREMVDADPPQARRVTGGYRKS